MAKPVVIVVGADKGGVGKTTVSRTLLDYFSANSVPTRAFRRAVDALVQPWAGMKIDKVAGIEARGFILAAPVATQLGAGFIPIRKKGKLPGATFAEDYQLEYGTATIEVLTDAFDSGDRVLVIDDVLATGGTARATANLVQRTGARVAGLAVLLELSFLHGRAKLADLPVTALITV